MLPSAGELRAAQFDRCRRQIKANDDKLTDFNQVMDEALFSAQKVEANALESRSVFCDGFKIAYGNCKGTLELQRFLNDHGIPSKAPLPHKTDGFKFVRLASQENELTKTLKHIKEAYDPIREEIAQ